MAWELQHGLLVLPEALLGLGPRILPLQAYIEYRTMQTCSGVLHMLPIHCYSSTLGDHALNPEQVLDQVLEQVRRLKLHLAPE